MAVSSPLSSRLTVAALLTLTAVTGLVDAVSYLRLGRVFVANAIPGTAPAARSTAPAARSTAPPDEAAFDRPRRERTPS